MSKLVEFTRSDLLKGVDAKNIQRAKKIPYTRYRETTADYVVHFDAKSVSSPGTYDVDIRLDEYKDIADEPDLTTREKVRLALRGDVSIRCSCPAFKYWGYDYITTQLGSKLGDPENRYPHIRNPRLEGVLCKHAYATLKVLPLNWMKIAKDLSKYEQEPPTDTRDTASEESDDNVPESEPTEII